MNEELAQKELARRLEQATSAKPQTGLDPEASAWREGWLAWGTLLESGNTLDPKSLKRLHDIPNGPGVSEVRKKLTHKRRTWAGYAGIASAAMVVSLLLAIAMLKFAPVVEPPQDKNIDPTGNSIANKKIAPFGNKDNLAWDDALDSRITSIEEQLTIAQYDSASLGDSFDSVRSRLESLSKEIEQNPM
jgi:hypothetical protein